MKSSADGTSISIGEAAQRFGLATHVLRHWESVGLLFPDRVAGDRRRYRHDQLCRIAVILRAREAGLSLDEIREMLNEREPDLRRAVLQRRRADLLRVIERATASLNMIDCALGCAHEDFTECATFQARVAAAVTGVPATAGSALPLPTSASCPEPASASCPESASASWPEPTSVPCRGSEATPPPTRRPAVAG